MKNIKLIALDVDGVLTDGKLYIGSNGVEYKTFHTHDGMGISLAQYVGIEIALITGRKSPAVEKRAAELKIKHVYQGVNNKTEVLYQIVSALNIDLNQVCYIGDDINDLPLLNIVGYPACPHNAVSQVKEQAHIVSAHKGGEGAVRDIIDQILSATYDHQSLFEDYLNMKITIKQ
ncbi:HAD-IIIA family hydrolase [Cytobacillus horneckiae]|uniref:KdsC family phosphatase n=1 Tax=Cytobacillus horneckiae TaxID=549687 RepID=UPI0034CF2C9B